MREEDGAVDDVVLVGRSVEVEVLETRLAAAVAGVGTVVLIEGEAGIGKSALVHGVAESAGRRGVHVFAAGTATDRGPVQPFVLLVNGRTTASSICIYDPAPTLYAKVVIDSTKPTTTRAIYMRVTTDPNCGYRSLVPGLPSN